MTDLQVHDNVEESRFETGAGPDVAVIDYRLRDGLLYLVHTGVPPSLTGQGMGSRLAAFALSTARSRGLEVVPLCPFVAAYIRRHNEYLDLVSDRYRDRDSLRRDT